MTAFEILAGGWRLVRAHPRAVAIWGVSYLVLSLILIALFAPMLPELMASQQQAAAAQAAGLPPPAPPAAFFAMALGTNLVMLLAFAAIFAAAVRAAAQGGEDRFGFLRFGGDELRLIGLGILLWLAITVATVAFVLVAALVVAVLGAAVGPAAFALIAVVVLAGVILAIWLQVRLSLTGAYTVLRGRIVIGEAWRGTKGRFWALFGAYFMIGVVGFVVGVVAIAVTNPGLLSALAGGMQPQDMQAVAAQQQAMLANLFGVRMLVTMLIGTAVNAVLIGWVFGSIATAAIGFDRADHGQADVTA